MSKELADSYENDLRNLTSSLQTFRTMTVEQLKQSLITHTQHIEALRSYYERSAQRAVICALTLGYVFAQLEAKRPKQWLQLVNEILPGLSKASIYRYRKLAHDYPDPSNIPITLSIRKAYALSGINASVREASKKVSAVRSSAMIVKRIGRLARSLVEIMPKEKRPHPSEEQKDLLVPIIDATIASLKEVRESLVNDNTLQVKSSKAPYPPLLCPPPPLSHCSR